MPKLTQIAWYTKFEFRNKKLQNNQNFSRRISYKFLKILELQNIVKCMIIKVHTNTNMTKLSQNT